MIRSPIIAGCLGLILVFATVSARPAPAHGWQADARPVTPEEVQSVLDTLQDLGQSAQAAQWSLPADAPYRDLMNAVYAYAAQADRLADLPPLAERVLLTETAVSGGVVDANGAYLPEADIFLWFDTLHTSDVPPVVARMADFDALRSYFLEAAQ